MVTLGMIGQGRMGAGMATRLRAAGIEVVAFDRDPARSDVDDLPSLVRGLDPPRLVWSMLPAGAATQGVLDELLTLLDAGDAVVDGANEHWRTTVGRHAALAARDIALVDVGVSGGVWGREHGFGLMVGGGADAVARFGPVFDALRPPEGGLVHVGSPGAGHFAKMIHNGIEYGMMQSLAEGFELLSTGGPAGVDAVGVVHSWRHGSVIRSWLLELLVAVLDDDGGLARLRGYVDDSGEGRWTVAHAVETATPAPAITAALYARFASRQQDALALRILAALRRGFGGHETR